MPFLPIGRYRKWMEMNFHDVIHSTSHESKWEINLDPPRGSRDKHFDSGSLESYIIKNVCIDILLFKILYKNYMYRYITGDYVVHMSRYALL